MDAAGSRRATLFGFSEGAALSMLFAATYPSRTNGLILYGALISGSLDPETSGTAGVFAEPAKAGIAHIARFERHGASPAAAHAIIRMAGAIEVRGLCPAIHAPCLVLHRRDDLLVPAANSRHLAEHLPAVRYVELEGQDHPPWLGDNELLLSEIGRFMAADHPAQPGGARLLQTIVMASEPLSPAELAVVERFRGRPATSRRGPRRGHGDWSGEGPNAGRGPPIRRSAGAVPGQRRPAGAFPRGRADAAIAPAPAGPLTAAAEQDPPVTRLLPGAVLRAALPGGLWVPGGCRGA